MTTPPDPLARAAALVRSLRPDWQRPETFHEMKSEALDLLRRVAATADRCDRCEAPALRERLARAHALLRASAAEADRLRRMLAEVAARAERTATTPGGDGAH
jgi:hypothetical protein